MSPHQVSLSSICTAGSLAAHPISPVLYTERSRQHLSAPRLASSHVNFLPEPASPNFSKTEMQGRQHSAQRLVLGRIREWKPHSPWSLEECDSPETQGQVVTSHPPSWAPARTAGTPSLVGLQDFCQQCHLGKSLPALASPAPPQSPELESLPRTGGWALVQALLLPKGPAAPSPGPHPIGRAQQRWLLSELLRKEADSLPGC